MKKSRISTQSLFAILTMILFAGILTVGIIYTNSSREVLKEGEMEEFKDELLEFIESGQDLSGSNFRKEIDLPSQFSDVDEIVFLDEKDSSLYGDLYGEGVRVILKSENGKIVDTIKSEAVIEDGETYSVGDEGKIVLKSEDFEFGRVESEVEEVKVPEIPKRPKCSEETDRIKDFIKKKKRDLGIGLDGILSSQFSPNDETIFCEEGTYSDGAYDDRECHSFSWECKAFGRTPAKCEVGIYGREPAHITFVADVSGSMGGEHRIGLLKKALSILALSLKEGDRVSLVTFSNSACIRLGPTSSPMTIIHALQRLIAGGGTNIEAGLNLGHKIANSHYDDKKINIVIVASDGGANVGATTSEGILDGIGYDPNKKIKITTIDFNAAHNKIMEELADLGGGIYYEIKRENEVIELFKNGATNLLLNYDLGGTSPDPLPTNCQVDIDLDGIEQQYKNIFRNEFVCDTDVIDGLGTELIDDLGCNPDAVDKLKDRLDDLGCDSLAVDEVTKELNNGWECDSEEIKKLIDGLPKIGLNPTNPISSCDPSSSPAKSNFNNLKIEEFSIPETS